MIAIYVGACAPAPASDKPVEFPMAMIIRYDGLGKISETYITRSNNIDLPYRDEAAQRIAIDYLGRKVFLYDHMTVIVGIDPCDESIYIRELDPTRKDL